MIRIVLAILALVLCLIVLLVASIVWKGYRMYRKALKKNPMKSAVHHIRSQSSFVPLKNISIEFIYIILIAEDPFFFQHKGYRIKKIYRAFILNLKQKRIVTGASTISQQLVKNLFFTFDKILSRKVAEIFAVRKLERLLTKEEILELYFNCIEYGNGIYGIKEACDYYFKIAPSELTVKNSVELAAVLPSPKKYLLKQQNELFQKSRYNIQNLVVGYIAPEDKDYFMSYADVPPNRRNEYSELFLKDYLQKKKERDCLRPLF